MENFRILVIDDEEIVREALSDWLKKFGYYVETAENGTKGLEKIRSANWHIMLVDLKLPDTNGLEILREVRQIQPSAIVIIITAYATVDTAIQAMKDGAYDYIVKPFDPDEINLIINKVLEHQKLVDENIFLRRELTKRYTFQDIIGKSPRMQEVFELIRTVGPTKSTILIQGESGTGKELVARAIHQISPRQTGPFVAVSCGALTESLLESELFGHEKGAFTGAITQKKGKFELSDNGTIFLDEIGDIDPKTQADLLRVLQEREFTRVGGQEPIKVDVRVIAATNKDIQKLIREEKFRQDLYYRLNVITINLPPLRERKEDIIPLSDHFLHKYNIENNKKIQRISEDVLKVLIAHNWHGNVRELEHTIEHAVTIEKTNIITSESLPSAFQKGQAVPCVYLSEDKPLEEVEKEYIQRMLNKYQWNIQKVASILDVDRGTLYNKIKKYNIQSRLGETE
ncbi:MAG: sigma-54 dependent transcriptional regulator [Planctomycetota bacterium]|nr:sigma-54 dependent transcriptional regulator [Planctomycetota bacterium]MDI6787730.1 sigma-54 dependent transcriptional regulator [Planctomycetota bacterium]